MKNESGLPPTIPRSDEPLLRVEGLTKSFGAAPVVNNVSFEVRGGEIVGLIGPNGCGKSTVIKMLSGFHAPDAGHIRKAERGGCSVTLAFVHQDKGLIPSLSIVENLALGVGYPQSQAGIDWKAANAAAARLIDEFRIRGAPTSEVASLAPVDVTLVAIARALSRITPGTPSVLIMDEPTSSLGEEESARVLQAARTAAAAGVGVLLVSHRLDEVIAVTNRVLIMRDAILVADRPTSSLSRDQMIELMLGRSLESTIRKVQSSCSDRVVLRVADLTGHRLKNCSFELHAGEIIGITGLLGSGKSELGRMLFGIQRPVSGDIEIDGSKVTIRSPKHASRLGIGYVPPDRRTLGGIVNMTAMENFTLPSLDSFVRRAFLRRSSEEAAIRSWMQKARVVPPLPNQDFGLFSGGNQQRMVYGKWIHLSPRILVLDDPTVGVDVGAVRDLYAIIQEEAAKGCAVLLLSAEWADLPRVCDAVVVLDQGRPVARLHGHALSADGIASAAFGHSQSTAARAPNNCATAPENGG